MDTDASPPAAPAPEFTERPPFVLVESARTWMAASLFLLFASTLLLISGTAPTLGLVLALGFALLLLFTHSITVRIDPDALEVRLGNGILRRRIALQEIVEAEEGEGAPVFALGLGTDTPTFGLGARQWVDVRTPQLALRIAVARARDVAIALAARRADARAHAGTHAETNAGTGTETP